MEDAVGGEAPGSAREDTLAADGVRVLTRYLAFRCPQTKDAFVAALVGSVARTDEAAVRGFAVTTLTGAPLLPFLLVTETTTFQDVRTALAAKCPGFPVDHTLLMYRATGSLVRVPAHTAPHELVRDVATLVALHTCPHKLVRTQTGYGLGWSGDIACPRCNGRGPGRRTGHTHCSECRCCGRCCLFVEHCGVDVGISVTEYCRHDHAAELAQKQTAADAYLASFYKWQTKELRAHIAL